MSDQPSLRAPAQVAPVETPSLAALLTLAVCVVVVAGLYLGREVLIPITLAVLLSFVLAPIVHVLRRMHLGRAPAVLLTVVLALALILGLAGLIGSQIADLADQIPLYQTTIEQKIDTVRGLSIGRISAVMHEMGAKFAHDGATHPPEPERGQNGKPVAPPIPVEVHEPAPSPLAMAERVLSPVISPLSTTAIVFIFSIFILLQRQDLRDRLIRLFGSEDLHRTTSAMDDAARRLSRYFLMQLAINAGFGTVIGTGLLVIGVPSPLVWGILTMLLRFVPYIGVPIASALPLLLAASVDPGWSMVVWAAALYVVGELVTGQVIEPLVYGQSTGLSPFSVIVAATFWTWLWGPIGLILSTPLTLLLVVVGRHVKRLEFLDVLLGDRPALTPVESFYQRMLAGDPDEALDQAELLLRDRPLSSYYDEVAIKGLQMAANDAARGVLTAPQLARIIDAVDGLIQDLDDHDDDDPQPADAGASPAGPGLSEHTLPRRPPPGLPDGAAPVLSAAWASAAPVLCVAGRGVLDQAAAGMLAQLLGKHGLGASVVPYDAVSRARMGGLDVAGVAMVCVTYLEIGGSPSHIRYLVRRLRAKMPHTPVLVGLWPGETEALSDDRLRAAVDSEFFARSLHGAVQACLEASRTVENGALAGSPTAVEA